MKSGGGEKCCGCRRWRKHNIRYCKMMNHGPEMCLPKGLFSLLVFLLLLDSVNLLEYAVAAPSVSKIACVCGTEVAHVILPWSSSEFSMSSLRDSFLKILNFLVLPVLLVQQSRYCCLSKARAFEERHQRWKLVSY
ncbi:hypothetical protein AKJ16_DCAP15358 [Drosera capensis]